MNKGAIILVGGPASGKTNYIARLWLAFKARKGQLRAQTLPENIEYVNEAVQHLLARRFAPRSERNMDESGRRDFVVTVRGDNGAGPQQDITVPDITGELWRRAVKTYELPQEWLHALKASSSAILFVRAHSKLNLQPMDWVTARDHLMGHDEEDDDDEEVDDDYGDDEDEDGNLIAASAERSINGYTAAEGSEGMAAEAEAELHPENGLDLNGGELDKEQESEEVVIKNDGLPAQVGFCELVRYLTLTLIDKPNGAKPRLAVIITAWDMLDVEAQAAGPMRYLEDQFPLFAGRLKTPGRLNVEVFGMSIVGGNLRGRTNKHFRDSLKRRDLSEVGYTVVMRDRVAVNDPDVTLPLAWALSDRD